MRPVRARAGVGSAFSSCLYHQHLQPAKSISNVASESRVSGWRQVCLAPLSLLHTCSFRPARQGATSMASNGFAPPAPRPATVETVETGATAKTSSTSSSHPVAAFHTRLIEELLADLRSLPPSRPTHQDKTLAEAFRKADSWGSLRVLLRAQFGPPGVALLNGDVETVTATGQVVLAALDRIGAAQLARECSDLDDHNASPTRRTDASGPPAANGGGVWHGLCELLAWLSAVRCAFVGETVNTFVPRISLSLSVRSELDPTDAFPLEVVRRRYRVQSLLLPPSKSSLQAPDRPSSRRSLPSDSRLHLNLVDSPRSTKTSRPSELELDPISCPACP